MKLQITLVLLCFQFMSFGQETHVYLKKGIESFELKDYEGAINNLDQAIKIDSTFILAYNTKATIFGSQKKYEDAVKQLNKVIELDEGYPGALLTRGLFLHILKRKEAGCMDFKKAQEYGDEKAEKYFSKHCGFLFYGKESLLFSWPKEENWRIAGREDGRAMIVKEFTKNGETFENWTEFGVTQQIKKGGYVSLEDGMHFVYDRAQKRRTNLNLTIIEKDSISEFPNMIFKMESSSNKNYKTPESQICQIVRGRASLYINIIAFKKFPIPKKRLLKWVEIFKKSEIVYSD